MPVPAPAAIAPKKRKLKMLEQKPDCEHCNKKLPGEKR